MVCDICGFSDCGLWSVKRGLGENWHIHRCRDCGFGFVHPRPSAEYIHNFYSEQGDLDPDSGDGAILVEQQDRRNTALDAREIFSTVEKIGLMGRGAKVLDVGAGLGVFSQFAVERDFEVTMLELSETRAQIAMQGVGHAPIKKSFEEYSEMPGHFDLILMSQILEHAIDINEWMSKACRLLKKGGVLVVAVPNFDFALRPFLGAGTPYIIPPEHLNFFSGEGLKTLLQKHSFAVRAMQGSSRIHPSFIKSKLGKAKFLWPLAPLLFAAMDKVRRGLFLRVFAVRT